MRNFSFYYLTFAICYNAVLTLFNHNENNRYNFRSEVKLFLHIQPFSKTLAHY